MYHVQVSVCMHVHVLAVLGMWCTGPFLCCWLSCLWAASVRVEDFSKEAGWLGLGRWGQWFFPPGYKSKVSSASELLFVSPLPAAACGLFHSLLSFKSTRRET